MLIIECDRCRARIKTAEDAVDDEFLEECGISSIIFELQKCFHKVQLCKNCRLKLAEWITTPNDRQYTPELRHSIEKTHAPKSQKRDDRKRKNTRGGAEKKPGREPRTKAQITSPSVNDRKLIEMVNDGRSADEIAGELGITKNSVYARKSLLKRSGYLG